MLLVAVAPGRVGQDDAAGVIGEQRRVGEGDEAAEAAAENNWFGQPERVAQPPQVISPGPQIPELSAAVIAAAVAPQVGVQDLKVVSQRRQSGLHRHVIQARAAVDSHQDRALYRRLAVRDDRRPGHIEPPGYITKADAHATSMTTATGLAISARLAAGPGSQVHGNLMARSRAARPCLHEKGPAPGALTSAFAAAAPWSLAMPLADGRGTPDRFAADPAVGGGHLAAGRVGADG